MSGRPFICYGYLQIVPQSSGLWYGLFKKDGTNLIFTQEINEAGNISAFVPFFDIEYYKCVFAKHEITCHLGHSGRIAFRTSSGVIETDIAELKETGKAIIDSMPDLPVLTKLHIVRIGRLGRTLQWRYLEEMTEKFLPSQFSRDVIYRAAVRSDQEYKRFWTKYSDDLEKEYLSGTNIFENFDTESLIRWLYKNPYDDLWMRGMAHLLRTVVFDTRLFDLLRKMSSSEDFDIEVATRLQKIVLIRGLEIANYASVEPNVADFIDSMHDYVSSGQIFTLGDTYTFPVIINFIDWLDDNDRLDTTSLEIYFDALREESISKSLAYALVKTIVASPLLRNIRKEQYLGDDITNLEYFKMLVASYGRLGLMLDQHTRSSIQNL